MQQADAQGHIRLPIEKAYILLRTVIEHPEIVPVQVPHDLVLLIEDREQNIH